MVAGVTPDQPKQPVKVQVLREVEVKTTEHAGSGGVYEYPAKSQLDYNNQITTIYHIGSDRTRLYFGSKNG